MRLYFDTRLGYLVSAPGSQTALTGFSLKAGDTQTVEVEFGESSDPTGSASLIEAVEWTKQQLASNTVIQLGLKKKGEYTDGDLLAGSSTYTYANFLYTFALSLNTTDINTEMERDEGDHTNDVATLACSFEVTYQPGGTGGWLSSIEPVAVTLYHDVLLGDESTPVNASDPDQYLLRQDAIVWSTENSIGDFKSVTTAEKSLGFRIQFDDTDESPSVLRDYVLEAGTDADSSPDVLRPDDFNASTNAKVWKLRYIAASGPVQSDGSVAITGTQSLAALRFTGTQSATLSSDSLTLSTNVSRLTVSAESGNSDTFTTISDTATEGDLLFMQAATGDTITLSSAGSFSAGLNSKVLPQEGNGWLAVVRDASSWEPLYGVGI